MSKERLSSLQRRILELLYKGKQGEWGFYYPKTGGNYGMMKHQIGKDLGKVSGYVEIATDILRAQGRYSSSFSQSIRNLESKALVELIYKYEVSACVYHTVKRCKDKTPGEGDACEDCPYKEKYCPDEGKHYEFESFWFDEFDEKYCHFSVRKGTIGKRAYDPYYKSKRARIHYVKLTAKGEQVIEEATLSKKKIEEERKFIRFCCEQEGRSDEFEARFSEKLKETAREIILKLNNSY